MPTPGTRSGSIVGGRYRLGRSLGQGGMGEVYEAVQENLGKRVAVKLLHAQLAQNAGLLARFKREAEAAAKLGHPNIVEVFDFGVDPDGTPYLVMELLAGESLARTLATQGRLTQARAAFIATQVLAALAAAHASGFVHRDLKPDNIFLTSMSGVSDIVKLLDFGIAKLTDESADSRLTNTGAVLGTPQYMSPEQARGRTVDARTDLYAMGVVMYEMLTGRVPFTAENYNAILFAILEDDAAPLASIRPDLDPVLVDIVQRAMARKPETRFADAATMRTALLPFATVSVGSSAIRSEPPPALANEFVTAPTVATPHTPQPRVTPQSPSPAPIGNGPTSKPASATRDSFDIATAQTTWSAPPPTPPPPPGPNFAAVPAPQTNRVRLGRGRSALLVGAILAAGAFVRGQFRRAERENERVVERERERIEERIREAAATQRRAMQPPPRTTNDQPTATTHAATVPAEIAPLRVPAVPVVSTVASSPVRTRVARHAQWTGGAHNGVYEAGWDQIVRPQLRRIDSCVSRPDYRPIGDAGFDSIITVTRQGVPQSVRVREQSNAPQQSGAVIQCIRSAIGHIEFGEGRGGEIEVDFVVIPRDR